MKKLVGWFLNLLISVDRVGNTLFFGSPQETISARIGKIKLKNKGKIPWSHPVMRTIDYLLDCIDRNHCIEALENEIERAKEVIKSAETLSDEKGQK